MAMPRFLRPCLVLVASATVFVGPGRAQQPAASPSTPPPAPAPSPVFQQPRELTDAERSLSTDAPRPAGKHASSSEIAAALAAGRPKYEQPKNPVEKSTAEDEDSAETDKPKNGIVRLPGYQVRDKAPPIFRERDIYTNKGLNDLARQRYITQVDKTLNAFSLPLFSGTLGGKGESAQAARARMMYEEDERLRNMADLKDTARMLDKTDKAEADYIRRATDDTFSRHDTGSWQGGPK